MAYNFNNNANEYELSGNLTAEMIDLYGLQVSYIKTEKVSKDKLLSEYRFLRADNDSVYKVMVYPDNTSGYDNQNDILSKFGMMMFDTISLYISARVFKTIFPDENYQTGINDLIVMPSQQIFEISEIEAQVPGLNNMFLYDNLKNVYTLKLKPYNFNQDQIEITDDPDIPDFGAIFDMANKDIEKTVQNAESKAVKNLDNVFGDLG
jgi:hypothetical protein